LSRNSLQATLLASGGVFAAGVGVLSLALSCGPPLASLSPNSICTTPSEIAVSLYFLSMAAGTFVVRGVWKARLRKRIASAEGGGLVIATGILISILGFLASNILPQKFFISAEIGFSLALFGSALATGWTMKHVQII